MERNRKQLLAELSGYDNYEDGEMAISGGVGVGSGNIQGNPQFQSQFNLNMTQLYYNVTDTANVLAAALPAALQVDNPLYIFGNSDFSGAYKRARQIVPFASGGASDWNFKELGILGRDSFESDISLSAPSAKDGDMIFISTATVAGKVYLRIGILSCPQVSYGTLLDSISSDRFVLNMIRYVVDATLTNQLTKQIETIRQTMFGKFTSDTIDPQTFVTGGTFNKNIADMAVSIGVDKNLVLGTQLLYNTVSIQWTITVLTSKKLVQNIV